MNLIIDLPYDKPPLSMNDRQHWAIKARITAGVRRSTKRLAKAAQAPTGLEHAAVTLHYRPRDNRRRDTDNLVPVLKACCDGLVDHGLTTDDTPDLMTNTCPSSTKPSKASKERSGSNSNGRPHAGRVTLQWLRRARSRRERRIRIATTLQRPVASCPRPFTSISNTKVAKPPTN